jgi:AcrR family transcriptional regulator
MQLGAAALRDDAPKLGLLARCDNGQQCRHSAPPTGISTLRDDGIERVCVEPLAAKLGVTKVSFYWHVVNREALIETALDGQWLSGSASAPAAKSSLVRCRAGYAPWRRRAMLTEMLP